jgi:hypothetical protein
MPPKAASAPLRIFCQSLPMIHMRRDLLMALQLVVTESHGSRSGG